MGTATSSLERMSMADFQASERILMLYENYVIDGTRMVDVHPGGRTPSHAQQTANR